MEINPIEKEASLLLLPLHSKEKIQFEKIGEREGSNPGGWYKNTATGEVYYLKLYYNPNNARMEYLANRIYNEVAVRAPISELFLLDDLLFVGSKKIGL